MNTAATIRQAVHQVEQLREESRAWPEIGAAVMAVKQFQSRRFRGTYTDLLAAGPYAAATRFFLDELYGGKDDTERDQQFARIAGAVERLFPKDVGMTAAALAQLHALTESLDHGLARALRPGEPLDAGAYVRAWREMGCRAQREQQLDKVLEIGSELARLTRLPGLRLMLKMMRAPAAAAGMTTLQAFLETGFDTFAEITRSRAGVMPFLDAVQARERRLLVLLFDSDPVASATELARVLGQAR